MNVVHVCEFESTGELRGRKLNYSNLKKVVLKAGRFSVFEATSSMKHAKLFTSLVHDSEVIVEDAAFPWTNVRMKEPHEPVAE